jgi:hypothetical protein
LIPETLKENWIIWRLVVARVATLKELETYYDFVDVLDLNDALDLMDEVESQAWEN